VSGLACISSITIQPDHVVGAESHLVDPALTGTLLSQELAVAVEQQDIWVTGRGDGAEGDPRGIVVDVEAGDSLPGRQTDAACVPARDFRLRDSGFSRRLRRGSGQQHEAGQGSKAADRNHGVLSLSMAGMRGLIIALAAGHSNSAAFPTLASHFGW